MEQILTLHGKEHSTAVRTGKELGAERLKGGMSLPTDRGKGKVKE